MIPTKEASKVYDHNQPKSFYVPVYGDNIHEKATNTVYPTLIDVDKLEQTPTGHPDQNFMKNLCQELREGAKIG